MCVFMHVCVTVCVGVLFFKLRFEGSEDISRPKKKKEEISENYKRILQLYPVHKLARSKHFAYYNS